MDPLGGYLIYRRKTAGGSVETILRSLCTPFSRPSQQLSQSVLTFDGVPQFKRPRVARRGKDIYDESGNYGPENLCGH